MTSEPNPSSPTAPDSEVQVRITELEIKLAFAEHTIEALNDVVVLQADRLDMLSRKLVRLQERFDRGEPDAGGTANAADERPPHY